MSKVSNVGKTIPDIKGCDMDCEHEYEGLTCKDRFDCCDCGGVDCGCAYCWSCNACDHCKEN